MHTGQSGGEETEKCVGFVEIHAEVLRRREHALAKKEKVFAHGFQTEAGTHFAKFDNGWGEYPADSVGVGTHQDELAREFRMIRKRDRIHGRDPEVMQERGRPQNKDWQGEAWGSDHHGVDENSPRGEGPMKLVIEQAHLHAIAHAGNHIRDAVPAAVDEKMERSGSRNRRVRRALNVGPPELGGSRLHFAPAPEAAGNLRVDYQKNKTGEHEAH